MAPKGRAKSSDVDPAALAAVLEKYISSPTDLQYGEKLKQSPIDKARIRANEKLIKAVLELTDGKSLSQVLATAGFQSLAEKNEQKWRLAKDQADWSEKQANRPPYAFCSR